MTKTLGGLLLGRLRPKEETVGALFGGRRGVKPDGRRDLEQPSCCLGTTRALTNPPNLRKFG